MNTIDDVVNAVLAFDKAMVGKPNTLPNRITAMCAVLGVELPGKHEQGRDVTEGDIFNAGAVLRRGIID